ncbi:MAG: hypothetical protein WBD55_08015 [Dehalococcoidia bacterium]
MKVSTQELRSQAEQHRLAGEAAENATLWQEAVREYEQCLSLAAQTADSAGRDEPALLTSLGRCYWNLSEARTAWRTLRRAISLYQERGDPVGQAHATVEILRIWGPPERHRMMAEEALLALGDAEPYLRARLLLALRWSDENFEEMYTQAIALAEQHGFEDILASRVQREAWQAIDDGRVDEGTRLFLSAHETYARLGIHDVAAGTLRGAGFGTLESGRLDEGFGFASRAFEYASSVNLHFAAQLALMDMAGVHFARGDFAACEALLDRSPGDSDFRGDLYRMWMAEARADIDGALRLMVSPERGGNTPTAVGQIHAAAAGLLFRAGKVDAASQALRAWGEVERPDNDAYWTETPALLECLTALGDDALLRRVYDSFKSRDERVKTAVRFSTLQGRALAPLLGGVCLRLALLEEAERHYREGLAWCERERCARDAALCRAGLDQVHQTQ